jgi:dTDP-4-dehydrorhamnose reductase
MNQRRWLVTGARGLLGSNAGGVLSGLPNTHVTAMVRSQFSPEGFSDQVTADLLDPDSLLQAIDLARPDVILHAAALASHEACEEDPALARAANVTATETIAQAAQEHGARLIYISTDAVFDGRVGNYAEGDTPNPFSVYGQTKLDGEYAALEYDGTLVVRTNFFGWSPSGTRSILEFFVNSLSNRTPVKGFTDFTVTSIYVRELIEAMYSLAEGSAHGILHVASHDALSKYDFGIAVAREFGFNEELIEPSTSSAVGLATPRSRNLSLNVTLAEQTLGKRLGSQREGIARARKDQIS